ncbi:MAG: DNA mismatch repair protein MutS, partial [Myxococcota bacterium]
MNDPDQGLIGAEGPSTVYTDGLAAAALDEKRWIRHSRLASNTRLICFAALLIVAWLAFGTHRLEALWIVLPAIVFAALVIIHDRILHREARATRVRRFFEDGLARLEDRWAGLGHSGDQYRNPNHLYAEDLDVFGTGSLFELLATTKTGPGSDRLASWLLESAEADTIRRRQAAVKELRPRLDLRLQMALAGDESGSASQQDALPAWAAAPAAPLPRSTWILATSVTSLSLVGVALWTLSNAGPAPFVVALILQSILGLTLRGRVAPILAAAETPVQSLSRTAALLGCLESEVESNKVESALLQQLRTELETTGQTPSQELEALRRLVDRRDARANQFFAPIAALLMWGTHTALALEKWRARCGPRLSVWIEAAGEIEALCALASFAYEHPDDIFPEIVESETIFDGTGLGHPLLPADRSVRNDLRLSAGAKQPQGLVMSGS